MNEQRRDALPPGARLDGDKYAIEEVLGSGGFGLVYRVRHLLLDEDYAIKEYLPSEIAVREGETVYARSGAHQSDYQHGLERFLKEARQLVRFDGHPNIIRCRDYFEANGTAYLVMDFEDGLPLDTFLSRREAQGQPLEESELRHLLRPLLEGLATVHAEDVLHRDIKPGNVFVRRRDGQPVLLDFGAAKEDFSKHSRSRAPHTPGYAAPEQVEDEGHLGPWTDLYAVGALMWRVASGAAPPKVEARLSALRPGRTDPLVIDEGTGGGRFSAGLLEVMRRCLHLDEAQRPQSAEALLALLDDEGLEPVPPPPPRPDEDKSKRLPPAVWAVTGAVLLLVGLGAWQWLSPLLFEDWRDDPGEALAPAAVEPGTAVPEPPRVAEEPGSLVLELEPSDARVILPDIEPRYRPGLELPAGEYRVVVRQAGYEEFVGTVRIEAGQRTSKRIVLVEQLGSLVLELEPSDARVILPDIEPRYRRGMELPAGEYRVVVRQAGYEEFTGTVRIESGERTTRSIVLRREAPARAVVEVFQDALKSGGEGPQMVVLPTGRFRMGSPPGEAGRSNNEGPVHTVTISRPIAMGRYEVTVGEFRRFVTARGYRTEAERNVGGQQGCWTFENTTRNKWDWTPDRSWSNLDYTVEEDQPVVCVSWNDAQRYIEWLNKQTDGGYRLPSESEWEYAVRAGSGSRYHFGDGESELCRYGNVADTTRLPNGNVWTNKVNCSDGAVYPVAVGSYRPNPFGLYDMHGNVWEWVEDCWHDNYEGAPSDGRAWTTNCDGWRRAVVRGGSWYDGPRYLRSAFRGWSSPSHRHNGGGFRLVQDLNP